LSVLATAVFGGVFAPAATSRADPSAPESFRLVWVRGERTDACADGPAIAQRVTARLGRDVFRESAARSIEGVIQHEGNHWEAHIYVRDEKGQLSGSRIIDSSATDCASIEAAVTLAIALTIDPDAALGPAPPPAPAPTPTLTPASAAPAPPSAPALVVPPCPVERPCPPIRPPLSPRVPPVSVIARGLVAVGLLPGVSAGYALAVELPAYRALHAMAGIDVFPETSTDANKFSFGVTTGWLGPCIAPLRGERTELRVCGKLSLGAIHSVVDARALVPFAPGERFWAAGSLSLAGRRHLFGPVLVEAGAELFIPITQENYELQQSGTTTSVFTQGVVAGAAFLGLGLSIP
jgi:hypothetical protein